MHRTDTEAAQPGLLSRLQIEVGRTAGLLFTDIDAPISTGPGQRRDFSQQVLAVTNASPIFLLANAGIALGFARLAEDRFPPGMLLLWTGGAILASLLPLFLWWRNYRSAPDLSGVSIRQIETAAVMLGLVWAAFPAMFFDPAAADMRILVVAVTFAISGIGSLTLARVPTAAILFCGLIGGSLSLTSVKVGGEVGVTFGIFALAYSMTVASMILRSHRRDIRQDIAAQETRRQNEIIALLLNDFEQGTSDWLWETDQDFRITYASPRLAELLGIDELRLAGSPLSCLAGQQPEAAPSWTAFEAQLFAHAPIAGHEIDATIRGEPLCWRISARPLLGANGEFLGYRGVGQNITREKRARDDLIRSKEEAEQANATKSQFLAVMSHELRTPLNAIVGFAELLGSSHAEHLTEQARADHLGTILESSRHLQALINDILDATRIEKGTLKLAEQEGDAAELVEVAVKMCRDAADRTDATIVAHVVDNVEIRGDLTRIKQVLINLVTNAVKFSNAGGLVNVEFERHAGGGLAIVVGDSGLGIRQEDLARVFEPFVQADEGISRRFAGVGLGLSIARKIARLHGGDVAIESEFGRGTTARLILPAARITWPRVKENRATAAA